MNEDLLQSNFIEKINIRGLSKNILIIKLILIIQLLFCFTELLIWYNILFRFSAEKQLKEISTYILPFVIFCVIILSLISWLLQLKGNLQIKKSLLNNNAIDFNIGFNKIIFANVFCLISFTIALLSSTLTIFYYK